MGSIVGALFAPTAVPVASAIGLGNSPDRAAYDVAHMLQPHGKCIMPIPLRAEIVNEEQGYRSIAVAAPQVGSPVVIDCFVRGDRAGALVDEAMQAGSTAVWVQLEVADEALAWRTREAGLIKIMDRCPALEWSNC